MLTGILWLISAQNSRSVEFFQSQQKTLEQVVTLKPKDSTRRNYQNGETNDELSQRLTKAKRSDLMQHDF